jgi:hypothetical protein
MEDDTAFPFWLWTILLVVTIMIMMVSWAQICSNNDWLGFHRPSHIDIVPWLKQRVHIATFVAASMRLLHLILWNQHFYQAATITGNQTVYDAAVVAPSFYQHIHNVLGVISTEGSSRMDLDAGSMLLVKVTH